ncbi:GNAT family N-acetyltransferase [Shewanella maritima]|uniref:GNAT family N-acetyltransferase n=1 Tax=Shewanella maritima TaxID=2520507 RepID=UPI003734D979
MTPIPADFTIRLIQRQDNPQVAKIIRQVSAEYGLTPDKGYGVSDPTLDKMAQTYADAGANYWVVCQGDTILGGAGIAPLTQHSDVAELQKMYFSKTLRGKKMALPLYQICQQFAQDYGYHTLYLETTAILVEALEFYTQLGFKTCQHLGDTGHDACEIAMKKTL